MKYSIVLKYATTSRRSNPVDRLYCLFQVGFFCLFVLTQQKRNTYKYRVCCVSCITSFNLNSLNKKVKCSVSVENNKKEKNPFFLIYVHTVSTSKKMVVSITLIIKCLLGRGNIYLCIYISIYIKYLSHDIVCINMASLQLH